VLFLTLPLLVSSQTSLNKDSCCVPCSTLKHALLMKADFDFTKSQLSIARDSVSILKRISNTQDLDIKAKNSTIMFYMQNESKYDQLLLNKDKEIDLFKKQLKKQKLSKRVIITIGVASLLFGVYKTL